jgi:hypothetical protein
MVKSVLVSGVVKCEKCSWIGDDICTCNSAQQVKNETVNNSKPPRDWTDDEYEGVVKICAHCGCLSNKLLDNTYCESCAHDLLW